ncbi:MAG: hypothetical protein KDA55_17805, partial [Planctomycetales bacterium]|nr:hypothetical protein [Planctomycetales bacterium]
GCGVGVAARGSGSRRGPVDGGPMGAGRSISSSNDWLSASAPSPSNQFVELQPHVSRQAVDNSQAMKAAAFTGSNNHSEEVNSRRAADVK